MPNIKTIDLNLLRVFDAVYQCSNVSQAAETLGLSQSSTSQALTRLRLILKDPLFIRTGIGVKPTERARKMAADIGLGLGAIETALQRSKTFNPETASDTLRIHLTDIGEARFLPAIMKMLREHAPHLKVESKQWPQEQILPALDAEELHFAIGFLPHLDSSGKQNLLMDYYGLLMRNQHPFLDQGASLYEVRNRLQELDFVAVHSHQATMYILKTLQLEHKVFLQASNFLALPDIIRPSNLVAIMPYEIAKTFSDERNCTIIDAGLPLRYFDVALHWSRRHENKPMQSWLRQRLLSLSY